MDNKTIKQAGLKITLPRVKILEILEESDEHLSAEDVFKILLNKQEDIGLGTIYRVLTQFETAGLIKRHNFETGQAVFELERGTHHDHLVCLKCGRIEEFMDNMIESRQQTIAEQHGFSIQDHSLTIYGICKNGQCDGLK